MHCVFGHVDVIHDSPRGVRGILNLTYNVYNVYNTPLLIPNYCFSSYVLPSYCVLIC